MINLAMDKKNAHVANAVVRYELRDAGILAVEAPDDAVARGEVPATVTGGLHGWTFERAWHYWIAIGPPIPLDVATSLWQDHGKDVRAGGDCACREPAADGWPGRGCYHIDTPGGLAAFASVLRKVAGVVK